MHAPLRHPWTGADADVLIVAPESAVKKHADYPAAKAGDSMAAWSLAAGFLSTFDELFAGLVGRRKSRCRHRPWQRFGASMDPSKHGGPAKSASTSPGSPSRKPNTFSASMLTPSEIEWLKHDSHLVRDKFIRIACNDERLTALIESRLASV